VPGPADTCCSVRGGNSSAICRGPSPRSHLRLGVDLGDQVRDARIDLVADGADGLDTLAGRVLQDPVEVLLAGALRPRAGGSDAAPTWLAGVIDIAEFAERYGPRVDGWTMPRSKARRERLAQVFGQDALTLCRAVWADDAPVWIREVEAVALLRQVLVQTYSVRTDARGREVVKKRDADDEGFLPTSAWLVCRPGTGTWGIRLGPVIVRPHRAAGGRWLPASWGCAPAVRRARKVQQRQEGGSCGRPFGGEPRMLS